MNNRSTYTAVVVLICYGKVFCTVSPTVSIYSSTTAAAAAAAAAVASAAVAAVAVAAVAAAAAYSRVPLQHRIAVVEPRYH